MSPKRPPVTTHVLDLSRGTGAEGIPVALEHLESNLEWRQVTRAETDPDGRVMEWLPPDFALEKGTYRLAFRLTTYFQSQGVIPFFPLAEVTFTVSEPEEHHHIPLLLSPYGYSTYRGT
ncbi:MAG: hydroxyisourate hydrolase [Candidatus Sumerlaeaceae bacterium]|nr:hydroxyisourate hydrolase [Candidatus Sumerlaeaceae bacterium]